MTSALRKITLMGAFIGLGVSLGFAFIAVPNVELVTATIFISGILFGPRNGVLIGCITEALYSLFNPYGPAAPPLFIAQIISMGIAGLFGGWVGANQRNGIMHFIQFGLAGILSTCIFAVLTTLSFVLFIEFSKTTLIGSFLYGLTFYATHLLSNTLIFIILVPAIVKGLEHSRFIVPRTKEIVS